VIRQIVLWLLRFLEQELDADLKQRLRDYQFERAKVEEEIRREKAALEGDANMLAAIKEQRARVPFDQKQTEGEIANLKREDNEIDNAKTDSASAGDPAVLRGEL
jgi:predicted nuclease with TOPRIM domain